LRQQAVSTYSLGLSPAAEILEKERVMATKDFSPSGPHPGILELVSLKLYLSLYSIAM
jgi:hypothetical protein